MRQVLAEAFKSLRGKPFDLFKANIKTRLESIPQGLTARGVKRFLRKSRLYIRPSLDTTKTAMVMTEDVENTEESTEVRNKTKLRLSSPEQRDEHVYTTGVPRQLIYTAGVPRQVIYTAGVPRQVIYTAGESWQLIYTAAVNNRSQK